MSKKILVVSQYFYPEQFRINDICTSWIKRGYEVTVLTGIPNYPQGDFYNEYGLKKRRKDEFDGVNIIRIPIIPRKSNSIMMALNYLSFVISGFVWNLNNKEKFDMVFIYEVSPMTQAMPGLWIAKKLKIPCYIYVMDLWPENFEIITPTVSEAVSVSHPMPDVGIGFSHHTGFMPPLEIGPYFAIAASFIDVSFSFVQGISYVIKDAAIGLFLS